MRFAVNGNLLLIEWNVSSSIDFHFAGEICSLSLTHVEPWRWKKERTEMGEKLKFKSVHEQAN
jgi:hypothetical protein